MTTPTQPLREAHRELLPHLDQRRLAADGVGADPPADTRRAVDAAYAFLVGQLLPHGQAEEAALYPVVGPLLGASEATATMRRDHVAIGRLTEELGVLRAWRRAPATRRSRGSRAGCSTASLRSWCCTSPRRRRSTCRCWACA